MKTLVYVGRDSLWRDPRRFVSMVEKKYHQINSEMKMRQLVTRATLETAKTARASYLHVFLPGVDLLADDLTTIPAWPWLSAAMQATLLAETIAQREARLIELEQRVNQPRLSRSYGWCERNGWTQDVEDADYDAIMATPARAKFWDPTDKGDWTPPPRAFDGEELFPFERIGVNSPDDAQRAIKERERRNYVPGANLG
jgi:hypothetical protein